MNDGDDDDDFGEDIMMLDGKEDEDSDGFLDAFADSVGQQSTVKGICY